MIGGLLQQTISLARKSGRGGDGRPTFNASTDISARVQLKKKRTLLPNGTVLEADGTAYVPASTTVNSDDKITYDSVDYRVLNTYKVPGGDGQTHHIKVEFVKWV